MSPAPRALTPPEISGYRFVELIGSGGYSTVYKYQQESPDRPVAVKVLRDFGNDPVALRQFRDEAKAMADLGDHAHIVPVFTANVATDGQPYLIMSYCPGPNLAARVAEGPLSVAEVVSIGIDIAEAVQAAHQADIIHRDIKPANILTDRHGARRLTDFGIAGRVTVADTGDFGVSIPWSPPEILGADPGSVASDLYSLGATLWHLLMGHSPYEIPGRKSDRADIEHRIKTLPVPPISRTDAPRKLIDLIGEMMARDPAARPRSARDVARQLRAIARQFEPSDTMTGTMRRPPAAPPAPTTTASTLPAELTNTTLRGSTGPAPAADVLGAWPLGDPDRTYARPVPAPAPLDEVAPAPSRHRWAWAVAAVAVVAIGAIVVIGLPHGGGANKPSGTTASSADTSDQNAGVLGEDTPPGIPTLTAVRTNSTIVHFSWTYSAALANDTFRWQTPDGKHHGTVTKPSVDLADQAGVRLCIQVKVVRADGSNATVDWSPQACAT